MVKLTKRFVFDHKCSEDIFKNLKAKFIKENSKGKENDFSLTFSIPG